MRGVTLRLIARMRRLARFAAAYLRISRPDIINYAAIMIMPRAGWNAEHGRGEFAEARAVLTNGFALEPRQHDRSLAFDDRNCREQRRAQPKR